MTQDLQTYPASKVRAPLGFSALHPVLVAFAASLFLITTGLCQAQTYRCGDSYSATPCADGTAIDSSDTRTPAQQKAALASTQRQQAQASALEKDRLKKEAAAQKESKPAQQPASNASKAAARNAAPPKQHHKPLRKPPEYFTVKDATPKKSD
jgi:hypothetical protein